MKKSVSLLLSILFFFDALPWHILSVHSVYAENIGISSQQLRVALALTGHNDGSAHWHDGMRAKDCTNAAQLLEVLDEFIYDDLDGLMDVFQDYDVSDADTSIKFDLENEPFFKEYKDAMDMRDEIYYCKDVLAENSRQIIYLYDLMQDEKTEKDEKLFFGSQIYDYYQELRTVCDTVKLKIDEWQKNVKNWDLMLCGETDNPDFKCAAVEYNRIFDLDGRSSGINDPVFLSLEKEVETRPGNTIMDRLLPVRSALADSKKKMEITVVDDRSFLIRVRENGTNIIGAELTLKDVDKEGKASDKSLKKLTTNNKALGLGLVRDYSPDRDGNIFLDIGVKKSGYRSLSLRRVEIRKGNTFVVKIEKDDGTPYLIESSYNGSDMLNNRYDLLVSDAFEKTDEITLITYGSSDYKFDIYYTKDGKKNILSSDISGKGGTENHYSLKKQYSKILPGDAKLFVELKYDGKSKTVPLQLNPIQTVVDEAMEIPGLASVFNKNITLNLPKSWPGPLSNLKINIDIPIVNKWPFNAMILPNGMAFVMVGFHKDKNFLDLKNNEAKIMAKMVKVIESEGWRRVQEIKSGGASDFKLPVWKLASMSLDWCIMGYGTGQFTGVKGKDDMRVLRLSGNVGLNVKLQGDIQFIFAGIVNMGITGSLNALVSAGLGVNIFFHKNGKSLKLQSFKFSPANSGLTVLVRLEIGVFVGIGFKGVLGVTVTGYGFLELLFRWGGATSFVLTGGFGARLTAQFFFIKIVKQLGDEIKYQLLPEFKRISRNPIMLERFVQMFEPAAAVADSSKSNPNTINSQPYNEKLILKSETKIDLNNVYGDNISVVRITTGEKPKDYVFYMGKEKSSSKVGLYYRQADSATESSPQSVLNMIDEYYKNQDPQFSSSTGSNRFYVQSGLDYNDVKSWDVVEYNVEVLNLTKSYSHVYDKNEMIIITMLMAKEYKESTASDGTVTKVPKKTAAMIATFLNDPVTGIKMTGFTAKPKSNNAASHFFGSAACVFLVAEESDEPVCCPQTETEIFIDEPNDSYRDWFQGEPPNNYLIRLMVSPLAAANGEKVKSFLVRMDLGLDKNENEQQSKPITGNIFTRKLGEGNPSVRDYTFENVKAGNQGIEGHPYRKKADSFQKERRTEMVVQDHWYALAAPKGKSDVRKLVANYYYHPDYEFSNLFVLDHDPILDFQVFGIKKVDADKVSSGEEHIVYLVKGADGKMNQLRGAIVKTQLRNRDITIYQSLAAEFNTIRVDYNVGISAANIHVSNVFGAPLVWWIETASVEEKESVWAVRGCWMDNGDGINRYISKPMTFAMIRADQIKNPAGPVFFDMIEGSRDGNSGITGYYAIKSADGNKDENQMQLHKFFFKLTPEIDLISACFTKDIANAGSYDDIQLAIHNNGNMLISKADLGIYYKNQRLQTVHIDMENNEHSFSEVFGRNPRKIMNGTSGEAAVRFINSGLSSKMEDRWHFRKWIINAKGMEQKSEEQMTSSLFLPGSFDTLLVTMQIPHDWVGDYDVEIRVDKIEVRDRINFQMKKALSPKNSGAFHIPRINTLIQIPEAVADSADQEYTGIGDLHSLNRIGNWLQTGNESPAEDDLMFRTDVNFDSLRINMDPKDIELDVDTWYDGDEEMATLYLNENAFITGSQKVILRSYVDDEDQPSFEWTFDSGKPEFRGLFIRDRVGWSVVLPVSLLTAGKDAYEILITVDSGDENEARFSNNYVYLYQDSSPMEIILEPEDRTIDAGLNTTFAVEVTGGHRPYAFQWQVLLPGGKWTDIDGACSNRLTLYNVNIQLDGARYRCLIEDASGRFLTSREAVLTILQTNVSLPPTGDSQNLQFWLVLLGICAVGIAAALIRKKKH